MTEIVVGSKFEQAGFDEPVPFWLGTCWPGLHKNWIISCADMLCKHLKIMSVSVKLALRRGALDPFFLTQPLAVEGM